MKKIDIKKLLLSLGTAGIVMAPIATAISCGSTTNDDGGETPEVLTPATEIPVMLQANSGPQVTKEYNEDKTKLTLAYTSESAEKVIIDIANYDTFRKTGSQMFIDGTNMLFGNIISEILNVDSATTSFDFKVGSNIVDDISIDVARLQNIISWYTWSLKLDKTTMAEFKKDLAATTTIKEIIDLFKPEIRIIEGTIENEKENGQLSSLKLLGPPLHGMLVIGLNYAIQGVYDYVNGILSDATKNIHSLAGGIHTVTEEFDKNDIFKKSNSTNSDLSLTIDDFEVQSVGGSLTSEYTSNLKITVVETLRIFDTYDLVVEVSLRVPVDGVSPKRLLIQGYFPTTGKSIINETVNITDDSTVETANTKISAVISENETKSFDEFRITIIRDSIVMMFVFSKTGTQAEEDAVNAAIQTFVSDQFTVTT